MPTDPATTATPTAAADSAVGLTPPPSPPPGYSLVKYTVAPIGSTWSVSGVEVLTFGNPGGAAVGRVKRAGKGWKTAEAAAPATATVADSVPAVQPSPSPAPATTLPAGLLAFVSSCEARGFPVEITAVAWSEADVQRLTCRWPSATTPSGCWSEWVADGVVSGVANPTGGGGGRWVMKKPGQRS